MYYLKEAGTGGGGVAAAAKEIKIATKYAQNGSIDSIDVSDDRVYPDYRQEKKARG